MNSEQEPWPAVVVRPVTPELFDHEDFRALVLALIEATDLAADQVDTRCGYLYGDAWPPDWTWINFFLSNAREVLVSAVGGAVGGVWAARWREKRRKTDPDVRPIKAQIFGPDGSVLREVEAPDRSAGR